MRCGVAEGQDWASFDSVQDYVCIHGQLDKCNVIPSVVNGRVISRLSAVTMAGVLLKFRTQKQVKKNPWRARCNNAM